MVKKKELDISLEEYLKDDFEATNFLSKNNDNFWKKDLKISSQIPVDWLVEKDPTAVIVGKEKEIKVGKLVNYLGAQIELQREMRFSDLFVLLLEVDHLKKNGFRSQIEKVEFQMENSPDYDWERDYQNVITDIELKKKYSRKKTLKNLFKNLEKVVIEAEIDYGKISDKLRSELPTPPTFYLEGPMGSGKSFIQRRLMLSYIELAKQVGIKGFDVLSIRDPLNSDRPKVIKLLGGEGIKLTTYHDNQIRRKKNIDKWKSKAITGTIVAFPTYYAFRIGLELAKYSWGLGIGVDPLADIGMWVNQNFKWIAYITTVALGNKFLSSYLKKINKLESKRPEWLANSKDIPPVYVGAVGRENLEGESKEDPNVPPQNWLKGSGMMTSDGKVAVIEQLPELTPDEQSWLAQLIQEREISIGNKGEHTIDIFPIIYMGANPHLVKDIEQPLMDRLQLGASCYVTNEIDRNIKTERKLFSFLEYYRKSKGGKPFSKKALETLLEISSKIAEDKGKIEISRRYLSVLDSSLDLANQKKNEFVTKELIIEALDSTKSIIEQGLEAKIQERPISVEMTGKKVGCVNILGYLTDKYMIEHNNEEIKRGLEEENGVPYIAQIKAKIQTVSSMKDLGSLKIITATEWENKEDLKEKLNILLNENMHVPNYNILVDLSNVFETDDSLLPAMYAAVVSAKEEEGVRQDIVIASNCDIDGNLTPVSKINKRIYKSPNDTALVFVSSYDSDNKINDKLDLGPRHISKNNVEELYEGLTK